MARTTRDTDATIRGRLVDDAGAPLPDAEIEIVRVSGQRLWRAKTDTLGWFTITPSEDEVRSVLREGFSVPLMVAACVGRVPVITRQHTFTSATFSGRDPIFLAGVEPSGRAYNDCTFSITGAVVDREGVPATDLQIRTVPDLGLGGSPTPITVAVSNEGLFVLDYSIPGPCDPRFPDATILVELVNGGTVLAATERICAPAPNEVVRFVVPDPSTGEASYMGPSESQIVRSRLESLIGPDTSVRDLTESQISEAACRLGFDEVSVQALVVAEQRAWATDTPWEAWYAVVRGGQLGSLYAGFTLGAERLGQTIEDATTLGLLPLSTLSDIPTIVPQFENARVQFSLTQPTSGEPTILKEVFSSAGLDEATEVVPFLSALYANTDPLPIFWDSLRTSLGDATVDRIQFSLAASSVTLSHPPLNSLLQTKWGTDINNARDLARFTESEWAGFLAENDSEGNPIGKPSWFLGTEVEYAAYVARRIEDRYPTEAVAFRLQNSTLSGSVAEFSRLNEGFAFQTSRLEGAAWTEFQKPSGVDDEELRQELRLVQRLFQMAPRRDKSRIVNELKGEGIRSAVQVAAIGRSAFVKNLGGDLGGSETDVAAAARVFEAASKKAAQDLQVFSRFAPEFSTALFSAENSPGCGDVDLSTIFGSLDFCECEPCFTVHSAAAYFVDLLQWLDRQRSTVGGKTALGVLLDRRPDLCHTELTCENTETPLPSIDLVNEQLERTIAIATGSFDPSDPGAQWPQTTWEASDLLARPEHRLDEVYSQVLSGGGVAHPWLLPFDLALEETRVFLEHLGTDRSTLLEAVTPFPDPNALQGQSLPAGYSFEIARRNERLGLSRRQAELVTGANGTVPPLTEIWGSVATAATDLQPVRVFLNQADITFDALRDLVRTRLFDGIEIVFGGDNCSLDDATLEATGGGAAFDEAFVRRVHSFLRTQRSLTWSFHELDAALAATNTDFSDPATPSPNDEALQAISEVALKHSQLKVELLELATLWGDLEVRPAKEDELSYYELVARPNAAPAAFQVDSSGQELVGGTTLGDEKLALLGIVRLTEEEFEAALLATGLNSSDNVTLRAVSRLYRVGALARILGINAVELYDLATWSNNLAVFGEPDLSHLDALNDVLLLRDRLETVGLGLADLAFAITSDLDAERAVPRRENAKTLIELIIGLQGVASEEAAKVDALAPDRLAAIRTLTLRLGSFTDAELADEAIPLVLGTFATYDGAAEVDARDKYFFYVAEPARTTLITPLSSRSAGETDAAIVQIVEDATSYLLREAQVDYVTTFMSAETGIEVFDTRLLLENISGSLSGGGSAPALEFFVDEAFWSTNVFDAEVDSEILSNPDALDAFIAAPSPGNDAEPYTRLLLLERIQKAAEVLKSFGWEEEQAAWIFRALDGEPLPGLASLPLDLRDLPTTGFSPSGTVADRLERWRWFARAAVLRDSFLIEPSRVFELASKAQAPLNEYKALVEELTGVPESELSALTDNAGAGYAEARRLSVFLDAAAALRTAERIGVDAQTVRTLGQGFEWDPTQSQFVEARPQTASMLRGIAKAKQPAEAWSAIAQPVQDRLRTLQRDALVQWLLAQDQALEKADDLLAVHLLDTQVSPCGLTSRLKNAISSVQLFVSRALMNLEAEVQFDDDHAREWVWMSRFRVWEANRKIFLWPENFLAPELRQDKTELFRRLEENLGQTDINDVVIEDAISDYLEGLVDLSRVDVVGLHVERDSSGGFVTREHVHVFGRSLSTPSTMYYRRRVNDAYWTPWEALPFQVEINDVLPVVANRRLFLFWPTVVVKRAEPGSPGQETYTPNEMQIRLNYAEYVDGKWRGPKTTTQVLRAGVDATKIWPDLDQPLELAERKFAGVGLVAIRNETTGDLEIGVGGLRDHNAFDEKLDFSAMDLFGYYRWDGCSDQLEAVQVAGVEVPENPQRNNKLSALYSQWHTQSVPIGSLPKYQAFQRLGLDDDVVANPNRGYLTFRGRHPVVPDGVGQGPDTIRWSGKWEVNGHRFITQEKQFLGLYPFTYQNDRHTFYAVPRGGRTDAGSWGENKPSGFDLASSGAIQGSEEIDETGYKDPTEDVFVWPNRGYQFFPLFHPYVCDLVRQLRRGGAPALFDPPAQSGAEGSSLRCQAASEPLFVEGDLDRYAPRSGVEKPYPRADFDFTAGGAMSIYNWELFVYVPLFIADRLIEESQFAEAQKWLHFVFDPTQGATSSSSDCSVLWKVKPLKEVSASETVEDLLDALSYDGSDPALVAKRQEVKAEVEFWRDNPFDPHAISRTRPQAIQRYVVMRYLDLLIAWGDDLFRQDTIETNNEATQIYLIAKQLLGDRPVRLPRVERSAIDFCEVRETLDLFGPRVEQLQNSTPYADTDLEATEIEPAPGGGGPFWLPVNQPPALTQLHYQAPASGETEPYFCIPPNEKMLGYWDTVDDRLFKLRNCLNIEGVFRQLPLFQPPIDPALIAKALAQGVDLASALRNINAPRSPYRFTFMLQLAKELAAQVASLGTSLLSVLEKQDAEALAQLRVRQQANVAKLIEDVREEQVREAQRQIAVLEASRDTAQGRLSYYSSRKRVSGKEKQSMRLGLTASTLTTVSSALKGTAAGLLPIPKVEVGAAGIGPYLSTEVVDGGKLAYGLNIAAAVVGDAGSILRAGSSQTALLASWNRRKDDWDFQAEQAELQIEEIDRQLTAAQIRLAIAERELEVQRQQISNAEEEEAFLRTKFSNDDLYRWMSRQLRSLYKSAFGLAVDAARRAERSYQFELAAPGVSFISYGQWDGAREGLLAGERLQQELRRMESSYADANIRERELTKRVSLAELDPSALEELKTSGYAEFTVPDWLFDIDHPSHYLRRLRLASATVPSVVGPFDSFGATLSYLGGEIRNDTTGALEGDPQGTIESISLSTGQDDAGLFEASFGDSRYLPFEYKGAGGSQWSVRLPSTYRSFDYRTISDVVLTLRYTARDGGVTVARQREAELVKLADGTEPTVLVHAVSLRGTYPEVWADLLNQLDGSTGSASIEFDLVEDVLPRLPIAGAIEVDDPTALLWASERITTGTATAALTRPDGSTVPAVQWTDFPPGSPETPDGRVVAAALSSGQSTVVDDANATWSLDLTDTPQDAGDYQDLVLIFSYRGVPT